MSFVSVTQQFNTTTSMGRLTLNILLSFAQFEREITGERIRDKFAASKKKGMWMGGNVPFGYRLENRQLIIEPAEARILEDIYRQYLKLGNVTAVCAYLDSKQIRTRTNNRFSRGALYHLLGSRLYVGEIAHRGQIYPGQHQAIIDPETWNAVAELLRSNAPQRSRPRTTTPSLLTGLVFDTACVRYASRAPQPDIARLKARMGWKQIPWYTMTDSFDVDFGVDQWHGHNVFFRDGEPRVPHIFRKRARRRGYGNRLELPRHYGAWPSGHLGRLARGLSADCAVPVVELA